MSNFQIFNLYLFQEVESSNIDTWENIRGPRIWEGLDTMVELQDKMKKQKAQISKN